MKIGSQASQEAALALTGGNQASMQADATVASVARFAMERIDIRNAACETLVPDLLAVATDPANHWRYVLTATVSTDSSLRADTITDATDSVSYDAWFVEISQSARM